MAGLGRRLTDLFDVPDHDPVTNGEADVLKAFRGQTSIMLDVGAFLGEWARLAADHCGQARIHCFELVGATRRQLVDAVAGYPAIVVEDRGLADVDGTVAVKVYPSAAWVSSLVDYPHNEDSVWVDEPVTTGDQWLTRAGYRRVDLLKIDAEGGEKRILDGFSNALSEQRITAVQLEYGRANAVTRWLLRDLYGLFHSYGYRVGRVRRGRVRFGQYTFEQEDFRGPNYLAVLQARTDLIDRLAGTAP